jgi:peroxiredoxin
VIEKSALYLEVFVEAIEQKGRLRMNKWRTGLVIGLITVIGLVWAGCSINSPGAEEAAASGNPISGKVGTSIGDIAPDFKLAKMDGSPISLSDLRGQPVVIVFWTAWCPVCKEEAPRINELAAQFEPKGVRVLGINIRDSQARAEGGIRDFGIQYQVARDGDASVARLYKVTGTPTVVFLDDNGVVRYFANELPSDYAERLETLISE